MPLTRESLAAQRPFRRDRMQTLKKLNKRQIRQVKRIAHTGMELDYFDNGLSGTGVNAGGILQTGFSTPVQGDSDGERVGDQINIKAFNFRFDLVYGDATNEFRVILFRWYQDNNIATPTIAQVLQNAAFPINSGINHDSLKANKLHIMHDKVYSLTQNGNNGALHRSLTIVGKKLGRKKIEFNNAAITGSNLIYAVFISDSIAAPNPTINWYSRLTYYDA